MCALFFPRLAHAQLTLLPAASTLSATSSNAFSQQLTASGGVGPYSYSVVFGALPAGITLNPTTGLMSGTPTQAGSVLFSIHVIDSSTGTGAPFSIQQTYALIVAAPTLTLLPAASTFTATSGSAFSQQLSASGGVGSYRYSIVSGTLPAGITLNPTTGLVSGTPTQAGSATFSIRATDSSTGTSAPFNVQHTYTLNVNAVVPVAPDQSTTANPGIPVTIDLMSGATGGPFTSADILHIAPVGAGSATINNVGTAGNAAYQMTFTSAPAFAGTATIAYTLSSAQATSAPANVNVTIAARPDLSTDQQVVGLIAAQTDTARRFGTAQVANFTHRLERLQGDGWAQSNVGLSLAPSNTMQPTTDQIRVANEGVDRMFITQQQPNMRKISWGPQKTQTTSGTIKLASNTTSNDNADNLPEMPAEHNVPRQALSLWLEGAVDFGQANAKGQQSGFKFQTNGISLGGDYRISDLFSIGVGAGFSRDYTDIGTDGSKSAGESITAAVYGSLRPSKHFFINGVLGYGTLNFDAQRYITDNGGFAHGKRDGRQYFGAIITGFEHHHEGWMWSPYSKLELMEATLDQYTETAAGTSALTYFKQKVRTTNGVLGLRTETLLTNKVGTWIPRARVEYSHQFQGADDARVAYADLANAGHVYTMTSSGSVMGNWAAGLGLKLLLLNNMSITLDYNSNLNIRHGRSQSVILNASMPFN